MGQEDGVHARCVLGGRAYVDSSATRSAVDNDLLAKNVKPARELGAEIVSTADENVGDALIRVARQENCTQILIGKPRLGTFQKSARILQELINKSGDLDVHGIGGEAETKPDRRFTSLLEAHSDVRQYIGAGAIPLLVAAACFPFAKLIEYQAVALVLLFTVALLSLRFGMGPVLLAAALSATAWTISSSLRSSRFPSAMFRTY